MDKSRSTDGHPSLSAPLYIPELLHRQDSMEKGELCWCKSGKIFADCHLGREDLLPFNPYLFEKTLRREMGRRQCSFGVDLENPCQGKIIDSHTVQKNGGLRAIARNGKVYSMLPTMAHVEKSGGLPAVRLDGIGNASVFPGFCSAHDSKLFEPIEGRTCTAGAWEALLFAYRAVAYSAFLKRVQLAVSPLMARLDEGKPVDEHQFLQSYARAHMLLSQRSLRESLNRKAVYDQHVREGNVRDFSFSWTAFDKTLPIVCCGTFLPEIDLKGRQLQRLGHGEAQFEQVTINVTSFARRSLIVFGWFGADDGPASQFVRSYEQVPDTMKPHAAVRIAIEFLENTYFSPAWWDSLDNRDKAQTMRHPMVGILPIVPSMMRKLTMPVKLVEGVAVAHRKSSFTDGI